MTLDTEQQRELLLQLIAQATFPGAAIEVVYDLKKAIAEADTAFEPRQDERKA